MLDIKTIQKFRTFATQEDYEKAIGKPCPPYDQARPLQAWEDPDLSGGRRVGSYMLYEFALQRKADGNWEIGPMVVPAEQARRVNILPQPQTLPPGAVSSSTPVPLNRGLLPNEKIVLGFGGIPLIMTEEDLAQQQESAQTFLPSDRQILRDIKAKLLEIARILGA